MADCSKDREKVGNNGNYADIFRFFPEAISLTRISDGTLLDINEAFEQLTGSLRVEIVGKSSTQPGCRFDPDGWREACRLSEETGEVRDFGTTIQCRDGRFTSILLTLRRVETGDEQCYLAVIRQVLESKQPEDRTGDREEVPRTELDILVSSDEDIRDEDVRRIIDFQQVQELMNSFYTLTKIGMAITDLNGNILVATGWQEICTKFHRVNPQTLANCIESDSYLSRGLEVESYKIYKCKNNMWDIATPIIVGGKHIANLFLEQFLFDDEKPDLETFTRQAEAYGFDKDEYLAALGRIPRWSRVAVHNVMEFYAHFARMIAGLGYRNLRLAKSLAERKLAEDALRESEERYRTLFEGANDASVIIRDGRIAGCNSKALQLYACIREDFIGIRPEALSSVMQPDGADSAAKARRKIAAAASGVPQFFEWRHKRLDGTPFDAEVSLNSLECRGNSEVLAIIRDITGRKRMETALRESEEKFAKAFSANPSILTITTLSAGRYIEINEAFERVLGFERDEVIGHTSFELNIWESLDARAGFIRTLQREGRVRELEARFRCKHGEIIVGLLSAEIVEINGEGSLLILLNDITARMRAEEALKISEAEKTLILDSMIDIVIYHDSDLKVLWLNRRALDSLGMKLENLRGRHCWEIWHQRSEPCEGCPIVLARNSGKPQEGEIRGPDGREWYVRGFPVKDDDGRVKGMVEFCLEITERKRAEYALVESERLLESEKRFRSLFEHMLDGVAYCRMLYDDNGCPDDFVYLDVNSAYAELTGLPDVIGRKVSEVLPGIKESSPELFEVYGRVASTGRPEKLEIYIKQLSLWRSLSVYSTEKGHFVTVFDNISERKRIEAELAESHHKLRELTAHLNLTRELERKALARKVHDELGTSLTLLKFDLASIKRNYPSADKVFVERIKAMDDLIHECTSITQRLTSELRPSLLDEQGLAAAIEWQTIEFETRSGIACQLDIDPTIPALSQDKAINVYRIFQESLSNVMRHANATSVKVSLLKAGQQVILQIVDNGGGISEQEISAATSFGIFGMEERARLCDGAVTIKGLPGKGTTILLAIPAWEE